MPEAGLEGGDVDEELVALANDHAAKRVDPSGRHNDMEVGMEKELLVPGVKDRGKPAGCRTEPFGVGEAVLKSLCGGGKEDVVGGFGHGAEKQAAQFGGQCERDHEIRRVDSLGQLALHPFAGGLAPALGTGFVVAAVKGKDLFFAGAAGIVVPAQSRGAALGDGADRTPLHRSE